MKLFQREVKSQEEISKHLHSQGEYRRSSKSLQKTIPLTLS